MVYTTSNETIYKGAGKHNCNLLHQLVDPQFKEVQQVNKKKYKQPNEKMDKRLKDKRKSSSL